LTVVFTIFIIVYTVYTATAYVLCILDTIV